MSPDIEMNKKRLRRQAQDLFENCSIFENMPACRSLLRLDSVKQRRFVRMFKPQFAEPVRLGIKLQTIRPTPKRMPRVGDIIDCRMWSGKPYRSKQVRLCEGRITEVSGVHITGCNFVLRLQSGRVVNQWEIADIWTRHAFAQDDGFRDWWDLTSWFRGQHGLPFDGILIKWERISEQ